jgi:quercetin dioxygenase-like cupin family protein
MTGRFTGLMDVKREKQPWGLLTWFSSPSVSNARSLVVIEVTLNRSGAHSFHKHPKQEEVIYVIEGKIEQWVDREKRLLGPGESAFIPANVVHASFNLSTENAKLLAILGPCIGAEGYELVDVADQEPWVSFKGN